MRQVKIDKSYFVLKNWWESLELTNYEKNTFNQEIIKFNQQLFRLKEKQLRIGIYGKAGVGKSSILNLLLNKNEFKTDVINGSTKNAETKEWRIKHKILKKIDLVDSPGFDSYDIKNFENIFSQIDSSEIILFVISGDMNRKEVSKMNSFIKDGKKIIIILNKIDTWYESELNNILKNIRLKIPKNINIPIILNSGNNIKIDLKKTIHKYGESLLTLNSFHLADKLFLKIKEKRLKKRQHKAQSIIGKFATIKASGVALNPLIFMDIAGSFALDTALISELSKIYGLSIKGESARKLIRNISINNMFLGATHVGINTCFNLMRKIILIAAPFTNGLSLLPYGPIAIIQAAIAVRSTKIVGELAAKEIFKSSKVSRIEPSQIIEKIMLKEPEIFSHLNFYLSNRTLNKNFVAFLP